MSVPPDPRERDLAKCEDMRLHAVRARQFIGVLSFEAFADDPLVQMAVIRCIEVIGEAARRVSSQTRERAPQIPWSLIVGMRHVLAHDYNVVDLDRVYSVATRQLPQLVPSLEELIRSLEHDVGWQDDPQDIR